MAIFAGNISGSSLTGSLSYTSLTSVPTGIVSSSTQIAASIPTGTVSSSGQVDYNVITNKLSGVVSSSTQVAPLLPGGTVSASGQVLLSTLTGTTFSNNAFYFPTDLRVDGNLTVQQIYTEYVSSSVIYESGSTKFGDTTDDVMSVTGSIRVLGGSISGSMVGMFSSSTQVDYNSITNKLSGVVSSSTQFNALTGTSASYASTASVANASTLTGDTLASGVTASSLTSVGTLSSLAVSGNLTLSSTGQRLVADMSSNPLTNRFAFQNSVANAQSVVGVLPNGTGTVSQLHLYNNATPTDAALAGLLVNTSEARLQSAVQGTGSYLPLTLYTSGVERARIDTSGQLLVGGTTAYGLLTLGSTAATASGIAQLTTATTFNITPSNTAAGGVLLDTSWVAGGQGPLRFAMTGTERMRLDGSGNLGLGTVSPAKRLDVLVNTANGNGLQLTNGNNSAYATIEVNGATGYGVTGWANSTVIESVPSSSGGLVLGAYSGPITFQTNLRTGGMTLTQTGNLGLGTTTPSARLNVFGVTEDNTVGGSGVTAAIEITNTYAAAYGRLAELIFSHAASGGTYRTAAISSAYTSGGPAPLNGDLRFFTRNAGTMAERMRISENGNVGIGTTPLSTARFQVGSALTLTNYQGAPIGVIIPDGGGSWIELAEDTVNGTSFRISHDGASETIMMNANVRAIGFRAAGYSTALTDAQMVLTTGGRVGIGTTTPSASLHVSGTTMVEQIIEKVNVTGSAPPTTFNVDLTSGSIFFRSASTAANWTANFRGNTTTPLNSMMYNGQSITATVLVLNGATAYSASAYQIDGASIIPRWQGGTSGSANANSLDAHQFTIIKVASASYVMLGSITKYT